MFNKTLDKFTYAEKRAKSIDMKNIKWETVDTGIDGLIAIINEGYAFTHYFKNNSRKMENFVNACFISIDVDGSPVSMESTIDSIDMKPTIAYYTASNLLKDDGYRFRLLYVFDEPIMKNEYTPLATAVMRYLEDNVEGYKNKDDCSKVINQFYFGNDKSESTMTVNKQCIYSLCDFISMDEDDDIENIEEDGDDVRVT